MLAMKWLDDGYECRFCGRKFAADNDARKHVLNEHPVTATGIRK
jgi:hypothetical protein